MKLFENASFTIFILCIIRYVIIKTLYICVWNMKIYKLNWVQKRVYEFRVSYTTQ